MQYLLINHTLDHSLMFCDFRVRISHHLVEVTVQDGILFRQCVCYPFLIYSMHVTATVSSANVARPAAKVRFGALVSWYISCVVWYIQKLKPLPAHSIITLGLKPLKTLVLYSSVGFRFVTAALSGPVRALLHAGQLFRSPRPVSPIWPAHWRQKMWLGARQLLGHCGSGRVRGW